eukprot:m.183407 g.183407  ORF g.183407 m.183407 type:complete len:349 (-) comp14994_c0_seq1:71-1117(-)
MSGIPTNLVPVLLVCICSSQDGATTQHLREPTHLGSVTRGVTSQIESIPREFLVKRARRQGAGAPNITAVTPNSGAAGGGTRIVIVGTNFGNSGASVTIAGNPAILVSQNDTHIEADTPSGTGVETLVVVVNNEQSNSVSYIYVDAPTSSPTSGLPTPQTSRAPTTPPTSNAPTLSETSQTPTAAPSSQQPIGATTAPASQAPAPSPSSSSPTRVPTSTAPTTAPTSSTDSEPSSSRLTGSRTGDIAFVSGVVVLLIFVGVLLIVSRFRNHHRRSKPVATSTDDSDHQVVRVTAFSGDAESPSSVLGVGFEEGADAVHGSDDAQTSAQEFRGWEQPPESYDRSVTVSI